MCAESFNVQLDMGEVAPMMKPKPVTDFGDISVIGDVLYIHKGISYENLICKEGMALCAYKQGGSGRVELYTYSGSPVSIKSITNVGNTLVISETVDGVGNLRYFLYKNGGYVHLGTKIPTPAIWFGIKETREDGSYLREDVSATYPFRPSPTHDVPSPEWYTDIERLKAKQTAGSLTERDWSSKAFDYVPEDEDAVEVVRRIWGVIDEKYKLRCANGEAVFPVFVRYAVRLYDGTLYGCSVPILLGGDISKYLDVKLTSQWLDETYEGSDGHRRHYWYIYANVEIPNQYVIMADFSESNLANIFRGWEDIVKSVDIFFSDQMFPVNNRLSMQLTNREVVQRDPTTEDERIVHADGVLDPNLNELDMLLGHQQTYLVKQIKFEEFGNYNGVSVMDDINLTSDWIINQEPLGETYLSNHQWLSDNLSNYNNSLLLSGVKTRLSNGHPYHVSTKWISEEQDKTDYVYVFHVRINGQICYVYSRNPGGNSRLIEAREENAVYPYSQTFYEKATAWIAYPDSRCFLVDILSYTPGPDGGTYRLLASLPMNAMSTQDVAYSFVGFGKPLVQESGNVPPVYSREEENEAITPNILIQSKGSNPFVTSASGVVTLSGDIINIGVVTTPLSEGQFGQFPLYVFTTEGVFALSIDGVGNFMTNHPVTREVLLHRNSIIGIEQGVFFVSTRGFMFLQGRSVTKMSETMDGRPDAISGELAQTISSNYFDGVTIADNQLFYQFLNGCKMAYDYANSRIVLFREGQQDLYVYKFDTKSWHRTSAMNTPIRVLNSYPEAVIVETGNNNAQIPMNYSTLSEDPEGEPFRGLIYTRELSLEQQDIYKTINRLKIRGRYADGHVKWALQGSNDGINYRTLHSLRGPSWKWYRIAIVTMLDAQERISYIELDYTPKFTDRLR